MATVNKVSSKKGKQVSKTASMKKPLKKAMVPDHHYVRKLHGMHRQIQNLTKLKSTWLDLKSDAKDTVSALPLLEKEFSMMRATLRAGLGDRPIKLRLSAAVTITTTVTSGVTNTVSIGGANTQIDISRFSEFSSCGNLFDEVAVEGFELQLTYNNGTSTAASFNGDGMPRVGYEVSSSTSATSTSQISELAHNMPLSQVMYASGAIGTSVGATHLPVHHFRFPTPKGAAYPSLTIANGNPGDSWVAIESASAGSGPIYGSLQFYHVGSVVTAIVTGIGVLYAHCKFRCRE